MVNFLAFISMPRSPGIRLWQPWHLLRCNLFPQQQIVSVQLQNLKIRFALAFTLLAVRSYVQVGIWDTQHFPAFAPLSILDSVHVVERLCEGHVHLHVAGRFLPVGFWIEAGVRQPHRTSSSVLAEQYPIGDIIEFFNTYGHFYVG